MITFVTSSWWYFDEVLQVFCWFSLLGSAWLLAIVFHHDIWHFLGLFVVRGKLSLTSPTQAHFLWYWKRPLTFIFPVFSRPHLSWVILLLRSFLWYETPYFSGCSSDHPPRQAILLSDALYCQVPSHKKLSFLQLFVAAFWLPIILLPVYPSSPRWLLPFPSSFLWDSWWSFLAVRKFVFPSLWFLWFDGFFPFLTPHIALFWD